VTGRHFLRRGAFVSAAFLAAFAAGCGSDEADNPGASEAHVESRVLEHIRELPPAVAETDFHGPAVSADCVRMIGLEFRKEPVYVCDVEHRDTTLAVWCAALVDDTLYTDRDTRAKNLDCETGS
jgi:hypothetical protein